MHPTYIRSLIVAALAVLPATAQASAFPQPEGEGRIITTFVLSAAKKGYDGNGHVVDIPNYNQANVYVEGEYGLTSDLTLLLSPSYRHVQVQGPGRDTSGLNFIDAGARYRVGSAGGADFSLQGSVRIPGKTYRDTLAQVSQQGTEVDLRGMVGTGFGPEGKTGFVSAEAGYRFRTGDPPNEFHFDLTLGVRPAPKVLLLANLFNTVSDGSGRAPFADYRYHNLYLSAVYDLSDHIAVQVGVQGTLDGENALRERGLVAGFWVRF